MLREKAHLVDLPDGLRVQFSALEARLWKVETASAIALGLSGLVISLLALFVSDRLWDTPVWLRVLLTVIGFSASVCMAIVWAERWVLHRRDQRSLAILVQGRYRRLGDRLLGIVELADESCRPEHFSPALYRAAIEQVAAEAKQFDFPRAVELRIFKACLIVAGFLAATLLVLALLAPGATGNAFARWIAPTAAIERNTLVRLVGLPHEQVVPHGEPFDIACSIKFQSFWRPSLAHGQLAGAPNLRASRQGDQLVIRVPGQVRPGLLQIRLGDARQQVKVSPVHRPSLRTLTASVQLPSYLQASLTATQAESGSVNVLEGSQVAFQGKVSRALRTAQFRVAEHDPQILAVTNDSFSTPSLALDGSEQLSFSWQDEFGLAPLAPWRLQVQWQKDQAPTPEFPDLQRELAILQGEMLDLRLVARDDFGVREMGLGWQLFTETNAASPQIFRTAAPTPHEKQLDHVFEFSPELLMIPPNSTVEMRGYATDYFPDRQPSLTPVYRIHVLGNEEHAELVRQNLESLLSRLEEVTRAEEKLNASTHELEQMASDKLKSDEAAEHIAEAKQEQAQNADLLEQLAKEGVKTLREAVRNPLFPDDTLRDWAKTLQSMQSLSKEQMQDIAKALKSAQENADSRASDLTQARQKEEQVLEALEQMQRNVNKGLDQLQAMTLAQRLRKIATDEKTIAGRLKRIIPDIIGLLPKELASQYQGAETALAGDQEAAQKETQVLHGEIGRFFERTRKEAYGKVQKQMTEAHAADELDRLRSLIHENISMDAMQSLNSWSDRLNAWADLLQPKSESSGSGSGQGGEGNSQDEGLLKALMGMLRARDREVSLRQRTGLVEKEDHLQRSYAKAAEALAAHQTEVREDMTKVQGDNPIPALEFPLQEIVDSMEGVHGLLAKPQTDQETVAAQTKTIEQLSDLINLINEQQQQDSSSSSQSASAEEMAFLMQMMSAQQSAGSAGMNPKGGGNRAGGTTDRTAEATPGNPNGKPGETRTVNRAGGSTVNLPSEFREAIEDYFRGVEALEEKP